MQDFSIYRNNEGRIDINLAEEMGALDIERNPQYSLVGARPKYWCSSPYGDILFKKTLIFNYEDYGELLGYEFANLIGLPCAEYDFAVFNNEPGVITPDIVGEDEELIGGNEILETVNTSHILPIQNACLRYSKLRQEYDKNDDIVKYIVALETMYDKLKLREPSLDKEIKDIPLYDVERLPLLKQKLEAYFDELSLLYEYSYTGYNAAVMTDKEREEKREFDAYFASRNKTLSGWNKKKQVVVSNNLLDIWSLIDEFCSIKGYKQDPNGNIMLGLIKLSMYDTILNQGDRHISNWSILLNKKTNEVRFAPIYDNSKICSLNIAREKLLQKHMTIVAYEKDKDNMDEDRKTKILGIIERNLDIGKEAKMMVDYDDNYEKNNRFKMVEKLLEVSDDEVFTIVKDMASKFTQENIDNIYNQVETKTGVKIPDEVKGITTRTIELNIQRINDIIKKYDGRRVMK